MRGNGVTVCCVRVEKVYPRQAISQSYRSTRWERQSSKINFRIRRERALSVLRSRTIMFLSPAPFMPPSPFRRARSVYFASFNSKPSDFQAISDPFRRPLSKQWERDSSKSSAFRVGHFTFYSPFPIPSPHHQ